MLKKSINILQNMKFFNKVFLIYTLILTLSLFALANIITGNITSSSLEKDIRYNKLVLYNINSLFEQKQKTVLSISQQAYSSTSADNKALKFLENNPSIRDFDYYDTRKRFISFLESCFSYDSAISGISVFNKSDDKCYLVSKHMKNEYDRNSFNKPEMLNQINNYSPKAIVYPAYTPSYPTDGYVYTFSMNIKSLDTLSNTGLLMVDFNADGITKDVVQRYEEILGTIIVLTNDGKVVYDSSNTFYNKDYPYFNLLQKNSTSTKIDGEDYIINVDRNNNLNLIVAGIIPKKDALQRIENTKRLVFFVSFLCILTVLLFTYIITKKFSSRINSILTAIKWVRSGNLSTRIPLTQSKDELYEISDSFNIMCNDLEKYIEKVYISEINQKNAELIALQSQINPHFLYNTLEAIRMKASSSGAKEASDMILILSKLFRSAIKEETITDIRDEMESSILYLKLFNIRYGSKLSVNFHVSESMYRYGTIRHIIQPIIENYIFHGFDSSSDNNKVTIKIIKRNEFLYLIVKDNGAGINSEKLEEIKNSLDHGNLRNTNSIGLANVNQRIKIIMGDQCGVKVSSREGKGTTVLVKLLAMTVKELRDYVQSTISR